MEEREAEGREEKPLGEKRKEEPQVLSIPGARECLGMPMGTSVSHFPQVSLGPDRFQKPKVGSFKVKAFQLGLQNRSWEDGIMEISV